MDKIRNAAIILLGIGEKAAAEVLKNMHPKEVREIINAINGIDSITEEDVVQAIYEFFVESNNSAGIDLSEKEQIKNSLLSAVGGKNVDFFQGTSTDKNKWLELVREQPVNNIVHLIQDEHPQIITAIIIVIFNNISSEYAANIIKGLPKEKNRQILKRITTIGYISSYAIDSISNYFQAELENSEKNNIIPIDGLDTVANIISYMDSETEKEIMTEIAGDDKELNEKIQEKMFTFSKLADLDKKSLQTLLSEIKNEELIFALKGVDQHIKDVFYQNMSTKSAEILRDDLEAKGPVKISQVLDAQKSIIRLAKKMAEEDKIILSTKNNPDIVY